MSATEEREKEPSDKTKGKVEKVYGRGEQAVDAGGAVVGAGIKAAKQRAAASAAEAAAKEDALMQSNRIADWRKARDSRRRREGDQGPGQAGDPAGRRSRQARGDRHQGLGAVPGGHRRRDADSSWSSASNPRSTERCSTTSRRTRRATTAASRIPSSTAPGSSSLGGGKPSAALLRQIATLLGHPHLATDHQALAAQLGLARIYRTATDRRPGQRAGGHHLTWRGERLGRGANAGPSDTFPAQQRRRRS